MLINSNSNYYKTMNQHISQNSQILTILKRIQIPIQSIDQLKNGYKLILIANKLLYHDLNHSLISKAITKDTNRAGNNVININILLKYLKNDIHLNCPQFIKQLTSFNIVQDLNKRKSLIQWMICTYNSQSNNGTHRSQNQFKNIEIRQVCQNQPNSKLKQMKNSFDLPTQQQLNGKKVLAQFDNLYFASCIKQINNEQIQNIIKHEDQSEKVVKKGSFKLIKPKLKFTQQNQASPKQMQDTQNKGQKQNEQQKSSNLAITYSNQPQELKQISMIHNNLNASLIQDKSLQIESSMKDNQERKTIQKNAMRPPLHRGANKQNVKQTIQKKQKLFFKQDPQVVQLSDFTDNYQSHRKTLIRQQKLDSLYYFNQYKRSISAKKQLIKHDIQNLDIEITAQKQLFKHNSFTKKHSQSKINPNQNRNKSQDRNRSQNRKSEKKYSRKVFKIQLSQVTQQQKNNIVQWLILINLVPKNVKSYNQILIKAEDSVFFVQICNYYIGRGKQISYFKCPSKSAQIHSNFQKIFNYLNTVPTFYSTLIFNYDYFIPAPQETTLWNFLKSLLFAFTKAKKTNKSELIQNYETEVKNSSSNLVFHRSIRQFSQCKPEQKINSSNQSLKKQKYQSEKKTGQLSSTKSKKINLKKTSVHSTIQFVKQIPIQMQHKDLVQNMEPNQDATFPIDSNITSGYKELYLKKSLHLKQSTFLQTPKKHIQSKDTTSLKKCSVVSNNSLKKIINNQFCISIPKVTLQMQMKVLKWMKQNEYNKIVQSDYEQLLRDPIRNGVLINKILTKQLTQAYTYFKNPKSIQNCQHNYVVAIDNLNYKFSDFPKNFTPFVSQILKGEKQLFYGLIYYFLKLNGNLDYAVKQLNNSEGTNYLIFHKNIEAAVEQFHNNYLNWIRFLQKRNPKIAQLKIRSQEGLFSSISKGLFLYSLADGILSQNIKIKPNYQNPTTILQKQSNLKKIITYLIQNNLLRPQIFSFSKIIAKKDDFAIRNLIQKLIVISIKSDQSLNQYQNKKQPINFIKYIKTPKQNNLKNKIEADQKENNQNSQKQNNKEISNLNTQENQIVQIQVPWMRKLGFTQNLMLNDGVLLCRLLTRFTRQNIIINQHGNLSKPECIGNIRKALKLLPNCKWDQVDIYEADAKLNIQIYNYIRQKFKHSYEMAAKK